MTWKYEFEERTGCDRISRRLEKIYGGLNILDPLVGLQSLGKPLVLFLNQVHGGKRDV